MAMRLILERSRHSPERLWSDYHGRVVTWLIYSTTRMEGD